MNVSIDSLTHSLLFSFPHLKICFNADNLSSFILLLCVHHVHVFFYFIDFLCSAFFAAFTYSFTYVYVRQNNQERATL